MSRPGIRVLTRAARTLPPVTSESFTSFLPSPTDARQFSFYTFQALPPFTSPRPSSSRITTSSSTTTPATPRRSIRSLTTSNARFTNMASHDSSSNNNHEFLLNEVFSVKGKVALITGGGSGIGLMATQALAVNGATVYITGRTSDKLEQVAKTYGQDIAGKIVPITADITSKDDITKLFNEISSKEQHLDILINNAGISTKTFQTESKSADEMKKNLFDNDDATFEDWDQVYRTNVSQCYFMTTAFLPLLQKATEKQHGWSGTVINISSISGRVKTMQHHPQYNASKAATIHLTRMLANEIQDNGLKVRVNSIAPGVFPSEMTAGESGADQKSHIPKDKYADKVPAARPGKDRDMAGAILFAATNQYFNGQTVVVDGGYELAAGL